MDKVEEWEQDGALPKKNKLLCPHSGSQMLYSSVASQFRTALGERKVAFSLEAVPSSGGRAD